MKSSVHIDFIANILIDIRFFGTPLKKNSHRTNNHLFTANNIIDSISSSSREAEALYNARGQLPEVSKNV